MNNDFLKILVYADIDMNLIDGSSVWLTSLLNVLSQDYRIEITLLLKRPIIRTILLESFLYVKQIQMIDPWKYFAYNAANYSWYKRKRLNVNDALELMYNLDEAKNFDIIISRGFNLALEICKDEEMAAKSYFYITDFPQDKNSLSQEKREQLKLICEKGSKVLCQTRELEAYFLTVYDCSRDKFIHLPPMIAPYNFSRPLFKNLNNRLIYVGKFASLWNTCEMIDIFSSLRSKGYNMEFHILGDKFNLDKNNSNFEQEMLKKLENTKGIRWFRGQARDKVEKHIFACDLGLSWRHCDMDESLELSTKVLEYARLGKPVILNRNPINESFAGKDYPLYANSKEEFSEQVINALYKPEIYKRAAIRLYESCSNFIYPAVYKNLSPYLWAEKKKILNPRPKAKKVKRLLFVGHDFKFARIIMEHFMNSDDFELKVDNWQGHNKHNVQDSLDYLNWAEIIICEWGLGNAVWYSQHKRKEQLLFVRMHRQEMLTNYPKQFVMNNINRIIAISPHIARAFKAKMGIPEDKLKIICNVIDTHRMDKAKGEDSIFHLGMLGYCPSLKRLDRALDIFERLWNRDKRYKLFIKGKSPEEYPWIWRQEKERQYYKSFYKRVEESEWKDSVIFEPWSDNVADWFRKIGFILSVSEQESFHLAVAEGMAAGSIPIIMEREGAAELFPQQFIFKTLDEAVTYIESAVGTEDGTALRKYLQDFVRDRYDTKIICSQLKMLMQNEI